jgi:hypothetical protein
MHTLHTYVQVRAQSTNQENMTGTETIWTGKSQSDQMGTGSIHLLSEDISKVSSTNMTLFK